MENNHYYFYVPNIVVVLNKVINPETYKDDNNGVLFNTLEYPLIFNVPHIVVLFDDVVKPETFDDETNVEYIYLIIFW